MDRKYNDMMMKVAVIGAGPGGMAAALQLKRQGIHVLLFERKPCGSLLRNAYRVENYLGCKDQTSGLQLLKNFQAHLRQHRIKQIREEVVDLNYNGQGRCFVIKTNRSVYKAQNAIIASGTKPKIDDILDEASDSIKKYILYEVFPIRNVRSKKIIIIGAGDAAFDFALNLSRHNTVFLMNRSSTIKALDVLADEVFHNQNIVYKDHCILQEIRDGKEKKCLLIFFENHRQLTLEADYFIAAIGRMPQKDFYSCYLFNNEENLINDGLLYLVGDVKNGIYRQISMAVADGVRAAMQIASHMKRSGI